LKFQTSLQISNITSGEEIIKSTLFCKVRYVLYSGINTLKGTFHHRLERTEKVAQLPLQSQEFKNIVQMEAERVTFQLYTLSLRIPVGTFVQKGGGGDRRREVQW
jgi:hypothetical protein